MLLKVALRKILVNNLFVNASNRQSDTSPRSICTAERIVSFSFRHLSVYSLLLLLLLLLVVLLILLPIRTGAVSDCSASIKLRMDEIVARRTVIKYTVSLTSLVNVNQFRWLLPSTLAFTQNQDSTENINKNVMPGIKQL